MVRKLGGFILLGLALTGCQASSDEATQITFASYEDCVLGKLGRGQSKIASQAIIDACRSKHPKTIDETAVAVPTARRYAPSDTGGNPYMAAVPSGGKSPPGLWDEFDNGQSNRTAPTFRGYRCTDDCSGHEAGYQWAEDNNIIDPDDCGGNSPSFVDGCIAWAEENG